MTELLASIARYFDGLQAREKLFVVAGAVAVAVVLSVKILLPLWETHDQLEVQKDSLETDLSWLREQREAVVKLVNNCPLIRQQRGSDKSILTQLVRRNQFQLEAVNATANGLSISMTGDRGDKNRFLQIMHQMACRGFAVNSVAINPVEANPALLKATVEVQPVD